MSIALDIGVHRLRSLRQSGRQLASRRCPAAYTILDDTPTARALLGRIQIPFAVCDQSLMVTGESGGDVARLFQATTVPLFPKGALPVDDPPARQLIATYIDALLPQAQQHEEICCLTVPAGTSKEHGSAEHDFQFLMQLVRLRGYTPLVLSASTAVILAELADEGFTGIGMDFGAASCEVSLAHRGIELAHCSIPLGGNWIDVELARRGNQFAWNASGDRHLDTPRVAQWKEQSSESILKPQTPNGQLLADLYRELLSHVVEVAAHRFASVGNLPQPMAVVAAGGSTKVSGFGALLENRLQTTAFPYVTKEVRVSGDSELTVARGCLIHAELESGSQATSRAA